jgi:signal peptidase II
VISPRRRLFAATAVLGAAADQVGKLWAVAHLGGPADRQATLGPLRFELSRNSGAAFGFGRGLTPWITVISLAAVIALGYAGWRSRSRAWALALGLTTAGAAGNLLDRLTRAPGFGRGAVVDWIKLPFYGPVFNLADVMLRLGILIGFILLIRGGGGRPKRPDASDSPPS